MTEDNGDTWQPVSDLKSEMVFLYEIDSKLFIACVQQDGVYFSTNNGIDWTKYNIGEFEQSRFRSAIKTADGTLLLGTNKGTLRSTNQGKSWQNVDDEFYAWSFVKTDNDLYAAGYAKGVRRSIDDGLTWTDFNSGLRKGEDYLRATSLFLLSDNSILCGTLGKGIFSLGSGEVEWKNYSEGLPDLVNFGVAEGSNKTLYTTSDKGVLMRNY